MTTLPRRFVEFASWVARALGRLATVILGFVMTMVGWSMIVTLLIFPVDFTLALLGIAVFLCRLFAPPASTKS